MISVIWKKKVQLHDESAEAYRRSHPLPETFSKMVLENKKRLKTADEIEKQYGLPRSLAEQYASIAPFFSRLRQVRDDVIHRGSGFGHVFETERGFCVSPKALPFSSFDGWRPEHYDNENIVSVLPWIADTILQTIDACNRLTVAFASVIQLPPEIAPGYFIFVRGPHNQALVELLQVNAGASPWWGESARPHTSPSAPC
jgi:hypothetical protein